MSGFGHFDRRTALRGGAAAAASVALTTAIASPSSAQPAAPGTSSIVSGYRELQTGIDRPSAERAAALANLDRVAKAYHDSMTVGGGPLWKDLPLGPGSEFTTSMYARLRAVAVNWGTPGGALAGDPAVLARIKGALELLYTSDQYSEKTAEIGNWYTYEIGIPLYLLHILSTVAGELTQDELAKYLKPVLKFSGDPNRRTNNPSVVETGANRADKSMISIVSGAMLGDVDRIHRGVGAFTDVEGGGAASVIAKLHRAAGDGFHTDGSFLQHDSVPYPGHYGIILLTAVASAIHVTQGTEFALPADVRDAAYALVADTFAPFVHAGAMMESVRGRFLSRQGESAHDIGHQLTGAVVLLARSASGRRKEELGGLAAKWITEDTFAPYLKIPDPERFAPGPDLVGIPGIEFAQELLATGIRPARTVATHRVFGQQDRMVHVTEGWSASLGVASTRISRYESINSMNLHGWYVGDGSLYLFLPKAKGHFTDAYWPTVDPLLLPGTTTKTGPAPKLESVPLTSKDHCGGVRWDARHGAHALDFVSQDGTLTAKKSWFFTPSGVLCLGAGITDSSGERIRTTIENRNLGENGSGVLLADGHLVGGSEPLRRKRWLHLEKVGGYVLLDDAEVTALREDRTGTWRDIDKGANTKGTTVPYTRRYQKLVIEHGAKPSNASYAYAVLPTASVLETIASAWSWRVRSNTATVQAVRLWDATLLANFFAAGSVDEVSVSGPASVALGRTRDGWRLAVSDPTQRQEVLRVTVRRKTVEVAVKDTFGATQIVRV
ncbi:polysaccharide lyase 8 family protein [Amycolatopsis roodepoortensis]|uniref:polysaccharide lyase 8 family protein n=1 Tax=Amycolatopsis roodepoortensis TaxID=700274 RepID=UPI00214CCBF7|nr:polysaccharide lyase 8 family protein [Amycolatopsis roodepoortensis]UUV31250.1 polysaccharide lyase 8 family protein [Amycolatopsis roodepoortensis]